MSEQLVKEEYYSFGDWGATNGEDFIKFIREGQAKARAVIPDQDVKVVINSWQDRTKVYLTWNVPYSEEEILQYDHRELISKVRDYLTDRQTFVKYGQAFPQETDLQRVIREAQALEAQMKLQDIAPIAHVVKHVLDEYDDIGG